MNCPDCGQEVRWVVSMAGKPMALNPDASYSGENGFFIAAGTDDNGKPIRLAIARSWLEDKHLNQLQRRGLRFYRRHMLTCEVARERRERHRQMEAA